MNVAYVLNDKCFEYLVCDSVELAESLIEELFSNFEDVANITAIDAEEEGCLGIGYTKIDNTWYEATHPRIIGWDAVRNYRAPLLSMSDWTQLPDSPLSAEDKQEWATYRQTLRDLTESTENPWDVVFPADPDGNNAHTSS